MKIERFEDLEIWQDAKKVYANLYLKLLAKNLSVKISNSGTRSGPHQDQLWII